MNNQNTDKKTRVLNYLQKFTKEELIFITFNYALLQANDDLEETYKILKHEKKLFKIYNK